MKKQLVFLAIMLTAVLAVAQPQQPGPGPGGPGPDQRWQGPQGAGPGPDGGPGWGQGPMGPQGRGWRRMGPGPDGFGPRGMGPGQMGPMGQGRGFGPGQRFGQSPGQGRGQGPGQRMMGRRGMGPDGGGPRMLEQLGLTEDQRTKIHQQMLEHRKINEKLSSDLRIKRWDLEELMSAANHDRPKIDAKMKELSDLHLAREKARLDQHEAFLKILTPEQREKTKQMGPRGFGRRGPGDM